MKRGKFAGLLLLQLVATLGLAGFLTLWPSPWNRERYVGMVLGAIGIVFLFTARFQLGTSFSVTPQARKLVTHGIYSKIRNPMYVFSFMMVVGVFLVIEKPAWFVLPALLLIAQIVRARKEAQVLEARFGDEYREYRRRTWF